MNEIIFQLIIFAISVVSATFTVAIYFWHLRDSAIKNNYNSKYVMVRRYATSITTLENINHINQIFRMHFYRIQHGADEYKSICRVEKELLEQHSRIN
jgi:hypothetical protein